MSSTPEDSKEPMAIPAAITRLSPQPGDILLIRTSQALSKNKAEHMRRTVEQFLSGTGVKALILPEATGVEVMSAADANTLTPPGKVD